METEQKKSVQPSIPRPVMVWLMTISALVLGPVGYRGIILGAICFLLGDDCSCFREAGHFQSEGGSLGQSLFLEFEISLVTFRKQRTRNTVHQDSWSFFTGTMQLPKVCKGWASATCVFPGLGPWFILIGFSRWDPPPRSTVAAWHRPGWRLSSYPLARQVQLGFKNQPKARWWWSASL